MVALSICSLRKFIDVQTTSTPATRWGVQLQPPGPRNPWPGTSLLIVDGGAGLFTHHTSTLRRIRYDVNIADAYGTLIFQVSRTKGKPTTSQGWYEIFSLSSLREPSPPERWPATSRGLCLLRGIPDATTASRMQSNARRRQQAALRAPYGSGLPIRYGLSLYDM
ncbi:hypothetical protein JMJ77_0004075 [Colletotrichum scovillei]|uniref:Uncharacterized protein n=1 Tax=Colletotrichum scovillei TaxID=1209932 RepID=A0A9P7QZS7_9PEZI|nr:hypothetical protein JMJ77_0004075 [Colletotrichum scovillei]KAG7049324.1 hypothetical protein JMJ78_0013307 [Colletotrichum scovillei]KAG7064064.1 hypothetical protein JMJ76_0007112 [Colletotrichum scovillei]